MPCSHDSPFQIPSADTKGAILPGVLCDLPVSGDIRACDRTLSWHCPHAELLSQTAECLMPPELLQYAVFGLLYYLQAEHCIKGVKHYLHALWFSVQTAATIGYGGDLSPDPYCSVTNALVTCQVIISLLTDYSMLGIVFTRFANPSSRTSTIRFSKQMAMTHQNGIWRLTFRVANIRKHQILRPEIRILLLRFNSKHPDADDAGYLHQELQITSGGLTPSKITWLGLPTSMSHIVDADSPLSGMMPADMEQEDMEILVLLDGIDATTSGVLQARRALKESLHSRCIPTSKSHLWCSTYDSGFLS